MIWVIFVYVCNKYCNLPNVFIDLFLLNVCTLNCSNKLQQGEASYEENIHFGGRTDCRVTRFNGTMQKINITNSVIATHGRSAAQRTVDTAHGARSPYHKIEVWRSSVPVSLLLLRWLLDLHEVIVNKIQIFCSPAMADISGIPETVPQEYRDQLQKFQSQIKILLQNHQVSVEWSLSIPHPTCWCRWLVWVVWAVRGIVETQF